MKTVTCPYDLIRFVAKTGFISKGLWREHFCLSSKKTTFHRHWAELKERGWFVYHQNRFLKDILVLNRRNKNVMAMVDGRAAYSPNPAQLDHDEFLINGLLKLEKLGEISSWQGETELKILNTKHLRLEAKGEKLKFPDAVVLMSKQPVALEYERTQKSKKRYREILNAYAGMDHLSSIVWVVKDEWISRAIKDEIKASYYPLKKRPIGFLMEKTWRDTPSKLIELGTYMGLSPT